MSKKEDGPKRQFTITIDEDLWPGYLSYMESHGIERPSHAAKSLISEALAATPKDGAIIAASKRAHNEITAHLLKSTGIFYDQMKQEVEEALRSTLSMRHYCPHCNGSL